MTLGCGDALPGADRLLPHVRGGAQAISLAPPAPGDAHLRLLERFLPDRQRRHSRARAPRHSFPWLSIIVANSLSFIAFGVAWNGIRVFGGRRPVWPVVAIAPVAVAHRLHGAGDLMSRSPTGRSLPPPDDGALLHARARNPGAAMPTGCRRACRWRCSACCTPPRRWCGPAPPSAPARGGEVKLDPLFISIGLLEPIFVLFGVMICGLGLTQQRREVALTRKAAVDGLTGLLNRGAFFDEGEQLIARARGEGLHSRALLVFDIDYLQGYQRHVRPCRRR